MTPLSRNAAIVLIALCAYSPIGCSSARNDSPLDVQNAVRTQVAIEPSDSRPVISGLPNFGVVSSDLSRGAQPTAEGFHALAASGIKTVVSLREDPDDAKLLSENNLRGFHIPLSFVREPADTEAAAFMEIMSDTRNYPVFVHCRRGIDRTGAMVALYRIKFDDWTETAAIDEMRSYGYDEKMFPAMASFVRKQR